jgi:hypothetical protein
MTPLALGDLPSGAAEPARFALMVTAVSVYGAIREWYATLGAELSRHPIRYTAGRTTQQEWRRTLVAEFRSIVIFVATDGATHRAPLCDTARLIPSLLDKIYRESGK